jgi:hypothetical protein
MASARHLGRIMRREDNFKNSVSDKTKRCGIERSHDSFNVYGRILEYNNGIVIYVKSM